MKLLNGISGSVGKPKLSMVVTLDNFQGFRQLGSQDARCYRNCDNGVVKSRSI